MRRVALAAGVVALLTGTFVAGFLVGQETHDEPADEESTERITDSEHDRLVEGCVAETDDRYECISWVARVVEDPSADGMSYPDLAEYLDCLLLERRMSIPDADNCRR